MQQNKTNSYVYYFVYFLLYTLAVNANGLTPDFLIQTVEEIQPGCVSSFRHLFTALITPPPRLWSQIVTNFVLPQTAQLVVKDRKVAAVGLTRLLTQSTLSLRDPSVKTW
jgi:exportin-2 (importin alpha re-exporter)